MTIKHTPAPDPWVAEDNYILDAMGNTVAICGDDGSYNGADEANAKLIQRAPLLLEENERLKTSNTELFEALRSVVNTHDFQQLTDTIVIKQAKATIEKYKETL
jgi:hypothetical protein